MKSVSFRKDLVGVQDELLRFAYKLTTDREEANDLLQETSLKALDNEDKYTPDTNFKGWMYTIMRNIFINNYRKIVRDQTFVDQTENLYHLNLPQDSGFESTERAYDLKRNASRSQCSSERIQGSVRYARFRIQIPRNSRKTESSVGYRKEPYLLYPSEIAGRIKGLPLNVYYQFSVGINRYRAKGSRFLLPFLFYVLEVCICYGNFFSNFVTV